MKAATTWLLVFLAFIPVPVTAQTKQVEQIRIVSSWGGLGKPEHEELIVKNKSDKYYANGIMIDNKLVSELIGALRAPVIPKPSVENLGINQERLNADVEKVIKESLPIYLGSPKQKELFLSSFKNLKFMDDIVQEYFSEWADDDCPRVEIEITDNNGTQVKLYSESQHLFMLPWKITKNGQDTKTYNANISRAVVNLMPSKFTNRERIAAKRLLNELASNLWRAIKDKWAEIDAEEKVGSFLDQVKKSFTIEHSEINPYHNVDYGKAPVNGNSSEINLHAVLKQKDFPPNIIVGLVLQVNNNRVENMDTFLNNIDRYKSLLFSIPWMTDYIKSNPKTAIELRFVHNRSFSEKAMQIFTAEMYQIGKEDLIKEVAPVQNDAVLLMVGRKYADAQWIVLPDKRMILWRFKGYDSLLKWKPDDFDHKKCGEFLTECVGAVISQDGDVISK